MEQHVLEDTAKRYQFIILLKLIYNKKTFVLVKRNAFLEHFRKVKQSIMLIILTFFENLFLYTFSELPSISIFLYYIKMRCSINLT
jgi:hypothetical protein